MNKPIPPALVVVLVLVLLLELVLDRSNLHGREECSSRLQLLAGEVWKQLVNPTPIAPDKIEDEFE
ncbi:hypothetical protein [Prosthecobacter sp.]|uniref:hypothetical protein n=1 Tax=Prosthecobacter sp. TaxID=1965333 RepID=UPI0037840B5B